MKKGAVYGLLAVTAITTAMGCYLYAHFHPAPKPIFTRILSLDEIKQLLDARRHSPITRSEDMQQAIALIAKVFQSARQNSEERKVIAEARLYPSTRTQNIPGIYTPGGGVFASLQAFQVNADSTRSPLGETVTLPENIVFYIPKFSAFQGLDDEKKLVWVPLNSDFFAEIVLYDLRDGNQIPLSNRSFVFIGDAIYDVPDDDILMQLSIWCPTPDCGKMPSYPVRPLE